MPTAQSGIFALGTGSHAYLAFTLRPGIVPIHLAHAMAALPEPRMTTGRPNLVVGFRAVARIHALPWHVGDQLTLVGWRPDGKEWRPCPDVSVHATAGPELRGAGSTPSRRPTSAAGACRSRAARRAPATICAGALSPP